MVQYFHMIIQNKPTVLGGRTLLYLISSRAKYPIRLIVFMIILTAAMSYWSKNIAQFYFSASVVPHYFAVSIYAIIKYGWLLSSILFVCFAIAAYFEYRSIKFTITDSSFAVSSGLVTRKEIVIPFSKIETVNLSTTPALRIFGLCSFVIKTSAQNGAGVPSSESEPDAILPAISESLAKEIQTSILSVSNQPKQ